MQAERIRRLLPEIYQVAAQPGSVLDAVLGAMEALHAPVEERLEQLDSVFAPRRTDDRFLPMLASWLGLDAVLEGPSSVTAERHSRVAIAPGNLRELVAETAILARSRGTLPSLRRFLELATGLSGFTIEPTMGPDGHPQPFSARIVAPAEAASIAPLIERIVAREKPAFTTVQIAYRSDQATSS